MKLKTTEAITAEYEFVVSASGDTSSRKKTIPANTGRIINEQGYLDM